MIYCASDLHIGYENTRYDKINEFFDIVNNDANKLILVGDTFDLWRSNWSQILNEHKDIIFRLANISKKIPVIIVRGNHDYGFTDYYLRKLSHNIKIMDKLETEKYIFIHGWQFDLYQRFGSIFYKQIVEYFPILYQIFFKTPSKIIEINDNRTELTEKIHANALQFALNNKKIVIIGHTHVPYLNDNLIDYKNTCIPTINSNLIDCGDFIDSCSYVTLGDVPKIHYL